MDTYGTMDMGSAGGTMDMGSAGGTMDSARGATV
jgi:hypothetical protein